MTNQDESNNDLKPCPFCIGGFTNHIPQIVQWHKWPAEKPMIQNVFYLVYNLGWDCPVILLYNQQEIWLDYDGLNYEIPCDKIEYWAKMELPRIVYDN